MKVAQPVAPVRATVCATAPGPDAKRCTAQPRSLGTVIRVPEKLPDSVRKLNALNAPTLRAILAILRLPSNENKRMNTARLARHFKEFGAVTLSQRDNAVRVETNPFLCGHLHPPVDVQCPIVVCAEDVRASAHLDIAFPWLGAIF